MNHDSLKRLTSDSRFESDSWIVHALAFLRQSHFVEAAEADGRRVVQGADGQRALLEDELPGGDVPRGDEGAPHAGHGDHGERVTLQRGRLESVQQSHFGCKFAFWHFNLQIEMLIGAQMSTVIPHFQPILNTSKLKIEIKWYSFLSGQQLWQIATLKHNMR